MCICTNIQQQNSVELYITIIVQSSIRLIVYCVIFCRLTAFVLRVLCEAQKYHHVDEQIMCSGVRYILSKQQPDGAFGDDSPIYHKEMLVRSVPSAWCTIQIQMCYARLESIL